MYFVNNSDITRLLKTTPDSDDLAHLLIDIDYMWYEIGLSLQVHHCDLDSLQRSPPGNSYHKLKKVIQIWKSNKSSPVTWKTVITVMESPSFGKKEIANDMCQNLKYSK